MATFKCKMCGGTLEISNNETVATCEYCGTQQTLPKLDDDKRANMYDRANHFRRNNEFDKAMGIYEQILNEDNTDAEAYWSLVLCRYGIEYVEDPSTRKRVPTVNRAQFTSIFDDEDYKSALKNSDSLQKDIYEAEAKAINEIQKGILAISQKEEPFDVFICYKETDNSGRRTPDSVLANDLYHQLTQEGFKVFFARITLEDKLGSAYEPYIFAALNSAKVMVVLGTKPEYFNAVWVKNEWSRFLALIKQGQKKILIPAYKDMDPYDLPDEFSHLQAQDMGKLGFMQDLIRGIKKLAQKDEPKTTVVKETVVSGSNANVEALLKRAFMFLEDGDFVRADEFCEQVLNQDPENANAYLGKLMAELQVKKQDLLRDCAEPFDGSNNYQKALRFGDDALSNVLAGYIEHINLRNENERLENSYLNAKAEMLKAKSESAYKTAEKMFSLIKDYKDSAKLAEECVEEAESARKTAIYDNAVSKMNQNKIGPVEEAIALFESIPGWMDADENICICKKKIEEIKESEKAQRKKKKRNKKIAAVVASVVCVIVAFVIILNMVIIPNGKYEDAIALMEAGKYAEARDAFIELYDFYGYTDVAYDGELEARYMYALELVNEGKFTDAIAEFSYLTSFSYQDSTEQCIDAEYKYALQLMSEGCYSDASRLFGGLGDYKESKSHREELTKIVAIYTDYYHTVGLKKDGTVVAVGDNYYGQCDVENWSDIVAIAIDSYQTIGLKKDGTVVANNGTIGGECDVSAWKDIVAISNSSEHTVGLKSDGTVVVVGSNEYGGCDVDEWSDISDICASFGLTVGLKKDGTVVASGDNNSGECNVSEWKDIVSIYGYVNHTIGLKSDGTVVSTEQKAKFDKWVDIVAVYMGEFGTVGLKSDGTVVSELDYRLYKYNLDLSEWKDIVSIAGGYDHVVGLKKDGTVVAVGSNEYGECDVGGWKDIISISADAYHTVGLKKDGTVVAVGNNEFGQCNVESLMD